MTARLLPLDFAALEPFAPRWAITGSAHRAALRGASSAEERQAFFEAAGPLLAPALDYLDSRPLAGLDAAEQRLMAMMLSLAHVAQAVEIQGPDESGGARWRERMRIGRTPADEGEEG
ncbi:hypothetical protein GCM10009087_01900 [Sphingomonas oligophenolica]|uniref:Uncharacterized protein n=1 Tax=Sphingomonas oligophenolica TaxID=301154 RepID=A0ABU9Y105_9SPHN